MRLIKPSIRNLWLTYASEIYLDNDIPDTAYLYAYELIESKDVNNKGIGYNVIFYNNIRKLVDPDSLADYATDYFNVIDKSFNKHQAQLAISQHSNYNYSLHKNEKEEAERKVKLLIYRIAGIIFFLLVACWVILWIRYRNKKRIIELRVALENAEKLISTIKKSRSNIPNSISGEEEFCIPSDPEESAAVLRERLRNKLYELYEAHDGSQIIPPVILNSESYKRLQDHIKQEDEIADSDPLWDELETTVLMCSPKFKDNLTLLVGGKLSTLDLHTSLLIKCGISPSDMTVLLI